MNDETQIPDASPSEPSAVATTRQNGAYDPGPVDDATDLPNPESSFAQVQRLDLMLEEFPEGPYGSAAPTGAVGKSAPWRPGQASVSAHRDQNPATSDRTVPLDEPDPNGRTGTIESEN